MNEYLKTLTHIKDNIVTFKSNYARDKASMIAEACSRGHITCLTPSGKNGSLWKLSVDGMNFLYQMGATV